MSMRTKYQLTGVGMIAVLALAAYLSFHPSLPFTHGYRVTAIMRNANQLRTNSPVRIAGVDVGRVATLDKGPGNTTAVELDITDRGLPLHRDATLAVRPRLFLEGGYYVELHPGTPGAPELRSGGTIPLAQTTRPVQLDQLLSTFDQPIRTSLKGNFAELATALSHGGGKGLHDLAPQLAPTLRDVAWVAQAAQGTAPHDVSRLIAAGAKVTGALATDPESLANIVTNLNTTSAALSADDTALADSIDQLDSLLRAAPSALNALDGALPVTRRVAIGLRPALPNAPHDLREATGVVRELGTLVAPAVRDRTINGLRTTFVDLPTLIIRMASLFPTVKPLSDCLRTHITPMLTAKVPDGALSTNRPVWQDFVHSLVGLASAGQDFDANGYHIRYEFGGGADLVSTAALPGIGTLSGSTASPLQSRPLPLPGGAPAIRPDAPCTAQALPSLETPVGAGGFTTRVRP